MPRSVKDPQAYDEVRKDGASKQKAARLAKTAGKQGRTLVGRHSAHMGRYDDWTVFELKLRAKELGLLGYSDKSKAQLIDMLSHH